MSNVTRASASSKTPRPVCTAIAACCPLVLLGLYEFLASSRGTRIYDGFATRNFGNGLVAFGLLMLVIAGLVLAGLGTALWAVVRRERPVWLARVMLVLNAVILLGALRVVM